MPLAHSTLIIIIAVAAAFGSIFLLLLLYRLFRRPVKQAPLPPKQELARYREHQAHVPESRPQTWYDSGFLSTQPSAFAASKSSLLPPDSRGGSPFHHSSLNMSESPSEDISHLTGTVPMDLELQLPHLPFDTSSTSLSTSETAGSSSPPLQSATDSSFSHTPPRHASSSARPHRRPRPLSVGSTGSSAISRNSRNTAISRDSRNTVRGVPHGPHSQVQLVFPAPLALGFNTNDRTSLYENSSRLSVVDQWAPMAVRSEGNPIPRPQRRSFSSSGPRRSTSQSSLSQAPINAPHARRAASASAPASAHHNRDYSNSSSRFSPPPVPQIPQQWLPPSGDPLMGIPEDSGRGRSRDIAPSAMPSERPPQPVDRPPPPDGQRKLQKRSRSRGG